MKSSFIKLSYRFLLVLLSTIFVFAGIDKILLKPEMVETFRIFGLPKEMMVIIGFSELVLAMMLQARYFTKLACHGLIGILSFGTLLHLLNQQYVAMTIPIVIIGFIFLTMNLGQKVRNLP